MKTIVKWVGIVLGALVAIVVIAAVGVYVAVDLRATRAYAVKVGALAIPNDAATIERGRHLATSVGKCLDCHGVDLGGNVFIDAPPFARLLATNLTKGKGGIGAKYSDEDFILAIRHGVRPDGRSVKYMPAQEFYHFTDADLAAIIAYIKSIPAVDREMPASTIGPIGMILTALGQVEMFPAEYVDHTGPRPSIIPVGATAEYGRYMLLTGGCMGCHGQGLSGGPIPGTPPEFPVPTNITPTGIGTWSEADFIKAMRTGIRPDGTSINPFMPWVRTAGLTDIEMRALYLYLRTVPPRPTGSR